MKIIILAKTNAKKNEVSARDDGSLVVAVTAVTEKGRANKASEKMIAKHYHVAPSRVRVVMGKTTKRKIVEILSL